MAKFKREHDAVVFFGKAKEQLTEIDSRIGSARKILTPGPLLPVNNFIDVVLTKRFPNCRVISAGQVANARRETDAIRTAFSLTDDWLSQAVKLDENLRADIQKYQQEDLKPRRDATLALEETKEGRIGACP